ncbi:enoyl-ACP reductase FabI [Lutibaculum baratangense]|uniref:Enoyl-[acyl-carrier-protein] reductase [NADH] n=1 Tax=Lutibaculum baratangense AMV1 TaxID=631454 RepID=V4RRS7_9HYPH|nr:enoyl-ACP reductase FabI [Lutibaculum baratangense]ESR25860.1 Enoyl-[acyl-carrier-protein] reductase [NADH] [Lutibaculum baratangense AMV1]
MAERLMEGRRGVVMGVANHNSIAWGIAKTLAEHGAEIAFTYQGEAFGRRVRPLAESVGAKILVPCDVEDIGTVDNLFATLKEEWGSIDFVVHAIAFSDKSELKGRYADTTRENFVRTMLISCFSFTEISKRAVEIMNPGGSLLTLTYAGSTRVMPNYNVMGVAKAGLEASVRYLASDFGPNGVRVNAISAGPVRTLAGAGITDARTMYTYHRQHAPLRRATSLDDVGGAALYLLSPLSGGVTGEVHFVDSGYHVLSMPKPEHLRSEAVQQELKAAE